MTTEYGYNTMRQRAWKKSEDGLHSYIYDVGNERLLAEYHNGELKKEYIYLGGKLIAIRMERHGEIYSVQADHLGRPQVVKDEARDVVWRAENNTFDRNIVVNKIGELNIGFPGQYFDKESGLYYNWNRDYDSKTGRYIQTDPIGIKGGLNTYAYVGGNPLTRIDRLGLSERDVRNIENAFHDMVNLMNQLGERTSPGQWNNLSRTLNNLTGGTLGEPYLGCWEQANEFLNKLYSMNFDDPWFFKRVDRILPYPHTWIEAIPVNDNGDPHLTADLWANTFTREY